MNDKSKNIILKLLKGIAYAYPIGFIALTLQWEYDLLSIIPYELQSLIDDLFYFGESSNVFDYGPWLPDRSILTYLFLLIIHFYIRSKIKLKAKQKQKKKTVLRSLVEKIGKLSWDGVINKKSDPNYNPNYKTDYYFEGILTIVGVAILIGTVANIAIKTVEWGDYLIVTDEEKAEMREQEAQKRQRERERQQAIENKRKRERIAELLPNAHPNVRRAIEAKGLKLSCGDENYTITFDDLNVYVKGDSNFEYDLEFFIAKSGVHDSGFIGDFGSSDIRYERFLDFKNWENWFSLQKRVPNTIFQFISMGPAQSSGCRATFNKSSTNSASKPKEPKLNAVPASKSIQEIRESVKNRTQDKDH
jgi:hypothetical protein